MYAACFKYDRLPLDIISLALSYNLNIYQESSAKINTDFMEIQLKIRQWKSGRRRRVILKAPENLFGLPHLSARFPNAKFVAVSRNEEDRYRSGLALTHASQRTYADPRIDVTVTLTDALVCCERRALEAARDKTHGTRVMRVRFEDGLFEDTFDIVAGFAAHADLNWYDAKQAHARSVIADRLVRKRLRGSYVMGNFGLEDDGIAARLETICDELPDTAKGLSE